MTLDNFHVQACLSLEHFALGHEGRLLRRLVLAGLIQQFGPDEFAIDPVGQAALAFGRVQLAAETDRQEMLEQSEVLAKMASDAGLKWYGEFTPRW